MSQDNVSVEQIQDLVEDLAELAKHESMLELLWETGGMRLKMRRRVGGASNLVASGLEATPAEGGERWRQDSDTLPVEQGEPILSSVVGVLRRGYETAGEPLVKVGDQVHKGQVVCLIESVSLTHEVRSHVDGEVMDILAREGDPVEYGQPLFLIAT